MKCRTICHTMSLCRGMPVPIYNEYGKLVTVQKFASHEEALQFSRDLHGVHTETSAPVLSGPSQTGCRRALILTQLSTHAMSRLTPIHFRRWLVGGVATRCGGGIVVAIPRRFASINTCAPRAAPATQQRNAGSVSAILPQHGAGAVAHSAMARGLQPQSADPQ